MASDPKSEDELARTATAPGSRAAPGAAPELGAALGRFKLERELGAGGMGVVHAAFDPDLERRVALKVLRTETGSRDARDRLQREARAMARLAHPNVVTVHEVGTVNGRDYVAMELIDGETLAEWLRAERRSKHEIVAAFVAAGRGLAAAHAAGLVHRDFKPHNVLRRRDGRIVVTDFGLARGVEAANLALETTLPTLPDEVGSTTTPSSLVVLTQTGSVLGTPAYMAPEQWSGQGVGPPADQFAFCVALWEAITGERPFRGETIDALKAEVRRGPSAEDAAKLPRRLRATLRRGLEPDPARRWPSMDALLARLVRGERRPGVALVVAGVAVLGAIALVLAFGRHGVPACETPALDPAAVWSADRAAALVHADQAIAASAIDTDVLHWRQVRARACHAEPGVRERRLACLDGVIARIDAIARATATVKDAPAVEAVDRLIDPAVCEGPRPPRLLPATSPELRDMLAAWLQSTTAKSPLTAADANALVARAGGEPCAAAVGHLLAAGTRTSSTERGRELDEAERSAQRCGDDRLGAEIGIQSALATMNDPLSEADTIAKVKRIDAAAEMAAQPDLVADLELLRAEIAARADNLDESIARLQAAAGHFAARDRLRAQLRADLRMLELREVRARPDDLAAVTPSLAEWRTLAVRRLGPDDDTVRAIDNVAAAWRFSSGDVAGAQTMWQALWRQRPNDPARRITGRVVDAAGAPVAGATVAAGRRLSATSVALTIPEPGDRIVTSRQDGTFEIPDGPADGLVVAQHGDQRSPPVTIAEQVTLALAPTSRLEGRVDLRGEASTSVTLVARDLGQPIRSYVVLAPVQPDGHFTIDGVARGRIRIQANLNRANTNVLAGTELAVTEPEVKGITLAVATSRRVVHVIVRSTVNMDVPNAQVVVMPGLVASSNALALSKTLQSGNIRFARPLDGEHAPAAVIGKAKRGDVYATVTEVPEGQATACAVGLPADMVDRDLQKKIVDHMDRIEVRCVPFDAKTDVVVVEVPPFPRLD